MNMTRTDRVLLVLALALSAAVSLAFMAAAWALAGPDALRIALAVIFSVELARRVRRIVARRRGQA